jgi:hypothetical protein
MRQRWFAIADAIGIMGPAVRGEARDMQPRPRIDALHSTRTGMPIPFDIRYSRNDCQRVAQTGGRP